MKKIIMLVAVLIFSLVTNASGISFSAMTGDAELDATLGNLNIEANANSSDFTASISISYGVSQDVVVKMMTEEKMEPADVYMAYEMAAVQNQPVEKVVLVYKKNKGKGWGVVAKEMGIKPGSDAFKKMKSNTGKTKKAKGHKDKKSGEDKNEEKGNKGKK